MSENIKEHQWVLTFVLNLSRHYQGAGDLDASGTEELELQGVWRVLSH